uniref:Gastric intrinsic factor n=1 Tax=Strix occidentalis caurina TaxID=311401 RepID=A0A8D0EMD9_STROC
MENHCPCSRDPPTLGHTDKRVVLGRDGCGRAGDRRRHQEQLKAERTPKETSECPQDFASLSGPACPEDERMLGVAFSIGVLLALAGSTVAHNCVASHHVVSKMLRHLEDSVRMDEPPNPSVLLAMNLAGATGSITHKQLLQEIEKEAVKRAQKDMTSGEVALYVLALISSCENPRHVQALGQSIDLLRILQEKTDEEVASLEVEGIPKTTLYSVSLDALSLCLTKAGGYQGASVILAKRVLSPDNTRAVAALAMACAYSLTDLRDVRELLWEALSTVTNGFLDEQEKGHGMIGNIYSTGLALQALQATGKFYAPRESCLPLWADPTWKPLAWTAPKPPTHLPGSFQTEQTSWGPMVVSIHGLAANSNDRTYWQFLSGGKALQEGEQPGVGDTGEPCWGTRHPGLTPVPPPQGSVPTSRTTGSTSRPSSAPTEDTEGRLALPGPLWWQ